MYVCTYRRDPMRFLMVHGLWKFMGLTSQANFNFNMLFWFKPNPNLTKHGCTDCEHHNVGMYPQTDGMMDNPNPV